MNEYVLDTETTGLSETDEIVEIAIIRLDDGSEVINTLVNPSIPISKEATAIHGITDDMAAIPTFYTPKDV